MPDFIFDPALYQGVGSIRFQKIDEEGNPLSGFLDAGDVEVSLSASEESTSFKSRRNAQRSIRKVITTGKEITLTVKTYDWNQKNLALWLKGELSEDIQTAGSVSDVQYKLWDYKEYILLPHKKISNVVVKYDNNGSLTEVPSEKISYVDNMLTITDGPEVNPGDTIYVSYDYAQTEESKITGYTAPEVRVRAHFLTAEDVDGPRFRILFKRLKFESSSEAGLIADDFTALELKFTLEEDPNDPASPYMDVWRV